MTDAISASPSATARPNLARLIIGGVCVLGMLATFMPWAHVPVMGTVTGTYGTFGYGWFSFIGFGAALLLSVAPRPSAPLSVTSRVIIALLALGTVWLGVSRVVAINSLRNNADSGSTIDVAFRSGVSVGNGIWLLLFAGVATIVLCFALRDRRPA